jgi:hypothetical protein
VARTPSWSSTTNGFTLVPAVPNGRERNAKTFLPGLIHFPIDSIISFYRDCGNKTTLRERCSYMKLFRLTFSFASLALLASAAPAYKFTLTEPAVIAGSTVKPGDYRIVVNGDKATLTSGKTSLEVPVKVETGTQKFHYTSVESRSEAGKNMVDDIQIGGTSTTLIFKR